MRLATLLLLVATAAHAEPRRAPPSYYIATLSADGKRALLQELGGANHYRIVATDTGKLENDLAFPALANLPRETLLDGQGDTEKPGTHVDLDRTPAAIRADLLRAAPLAKFPLGAGNRMTASPDGKTVAFNVGDFVFASHDGIVGKRLAPHASYSPWLLPDGATIMFRMESGLFPGTPNGNYELYTTSLDGATKPVRIPGTAGSFEFWALSQDGAHIRMLTHTYGPKPNTDKVCIVDIAVAAPFTATPKVCLAGGERLVDGKLSPHGDFAVLATVAELPEMDPDSRTFQDGKRVPQHEERFRIRTVDVDKGTTEIDDTRRPLSGTAISDRGLLVIDRFRYAIVVDSHAKQWERVDEPAGGLLSCAFRSDRELVAVRGDSVAILDVTKWQRTPWTGAD